VVGASEDTAGVAKLATQTETNAGSDTFRIVTPARLSGRTATEGRSGVVELATAQETVAGTDAARAVHPAGMKAAVESAFSPEAVRLVGEAGEPPPTPTPFGDTCPYTTPIERRLMSQADIRHRRSIY
jgi:hypothetical protein